MRASLTSFTIKLFNLKRRLESTQPTGCFKSFGRDAIIVVWFRLFDGASRKSHQMSVYSQFGSSETRITAQAISKYRI